jgi:glutaredoxin
MKMTNIIIAVMVALLLCCIFLLADTVYKRVSQKDNSLLAGLTGKSEEKKSDAAADTPLTKAERDIKEALENTARQQSAPVRTQTQTVNSPVPVSNSVPRPPDPPRPEVKPVRDIRDIKVILYMTDWCPHCKNALSYLRSQGVSLTVYDVDRDGSAAREMTGKTGGSRGVPVIDVEGIILRGYSAAAISNAIKQKQNS